MELSALLDRLKLEDFLGDDRAFQGNILLIKCKRVITLDDKGNKLQPWVRRQKQK